MSTFNKLTFIFFACAEVSGIGAAGSRKNRPSKPELVSKAELSDQCPEPDGYFADAEQCDKYHYCNDGRITKEALCPDGLVFNDYSSEYEQCDLPINIDCSSREKLQKPQPSENCPRKHGYFAHPNKSICDKFYFCVDGKYNMVACPNGLVYNEKVGICSWPDEAKRTGCSSDDIFEYTCPTVEEAVALTHPSYADPEDCQYFYVCVNGKSARRNGCPLGQVFDDVSKRCVWVRNVPECADWYKGNLTEQQLDDLENPPTPRPKAMISSKRKHRPQPVEDEE